MSLLGFFRSQKSQNGASVVRKQLQAIVVHEHGQRVRPGYLPQLQKDLLEMTHKYVPINREQIQVELEDQDDCSILGLNITLPDR